MLNVAKRRAVAAIFAVSVCLGQSGFDLLNAVPAPGAEEDEKKSDASSLVNPQMIPESRTLPVFPLRPQMEGVGAQVILGATILRNGSVADITVERVHLGFADGRTRDILNALLEDDFGFGGAAKAAVEQWKYRPALLSGEPVDARIKVVVDFVAKAGTPGAEEMNYCGIGGVTNPELIPETKIIPRYPRRARKEGVQARLILAALIATGGAVEEINVLRRTLTFKDGRKEESALPELSKDEYGFDGAARAAVSQWRYRPCQSDGFPVNAWFTIMVDFLLSSEEEKVTATSARGTAALTWSWPTDNISPSLTIDPLAYQESRVPIV